MKITIDLAGFTLPALAILERSARMNGKRLRWGVGARRVVARVLTEVAAQLRTEIARRKESPGIPAAEGVELGSFTPWECGVLAKFFEEEVQVYLAMRERQQQTPLEGEVCDLKACAVECAQFDQALAVTFAREAKAS